MAEKFWTKSGVRDNNDSSTRPEPTNKKPNPTIIEYKGRYDKIRH